MFSHAWIWLHDGFHVFYAAYGTLCATFLALLFVYELYSWMINHD